MFKKLFKALMTLTLLAGCYFGYVRAFAVVVEKLTAIKRTDHLAFVIRDSKSKQESIRYAREACGRDHWAADDELAYRYYNAERRYWIYAKDCQRIDEEKGVRYDGKRLRLTPFLLITKSADGKSTKTISSDVAVFDLSEPLGFNVNSSDQPLKIKHARLEPNVWVRDDKGTPGVPGDDMKIGPLTTVDYEESTQQITTQLDTYVVIQDPEMSATGYGLVMQLRKIDAATPGGSAGFEGVERLDLLKNVHVVIRDVGKSGLFPGASPPRKSAARKQEASTDVAGAPGAGAGAAAEAAEPTPLDLRCDSKMVVYLAKPRPEPPIGPPAPPAPTLVQFDRNVVVLRGKPDDRPDQLTCDTLKLSLIPGEKPTQNQAQPAAAEPAQGVAATAESVAQADPGTEGDAGSSPAGNAASRSPAGGEPGPLGGLTLQRVHATGHAVWLYLPAQGVKLVCNELIHLRQLPYKPDQTYFRGDRTRPLRLEKVDMVEDEGPDHGKITSVTNVTLADATIFDSGVGLHAANIVGYGPGRLETRADRDQPVERIAIWQDKLVVDNRLGADNELVHKIIDLTGNRPCFIDNLQKTSLDSASWIQVWLKPKPKTTAPATATAAVVVEAATDSAQAATNPGMGGGGLQMEQLHAIDDVHLLAPAKTMTARERLDAEFVDAEPVQVAAAAASNSSARSSPVPPPYPIPNEDAADQSQGQEQEKVAAADEAEKPADEPAMTGVCDRMWARVAVKPKANTDQASSDEPATAKRAAAGRGSGETDAEIRKVWMLGNVALHQDPEKDHEGDAEPNETGKHKGQDATGEAIYLDNRGPNRAISYIYQRDPTETTYTPGPLPPARIEKDFKITAAGIIRMNQGTDQAWVEGPGTLMQLAARGLFVEKPDDEPGDGKPAADPPADGPVAGPGTQGPKLTTRTTAFVSPIAAKGELEPTRDKRAEPRPATRAGRPISEKVPMTIAFSDGMEFEGRSVDPEGRPAAQADFHGIVTARMEDGLLHCTDKMIVFTDREVPLAQLGKMSRGQSRKNSSGEADDENAEPEPQAELALIYCYRSAVAISRKVDPDSPTLVQQQRIEADDILFYDRRTGDFFVPGKGKVFMYDHSDDSAAKPGADGGGDGKTKAGPKLTATERTVSTTSGRVQTRTTAPPPSAKTATTKVATRSKGSPKAKTSGKPADNLPLTLTQIHFNKAMRGQFGNVGENASGERRWSEFFGDVESARAKVATAGTKLNFDRLPADGVFLTGQTMRVIQDPPPVGSPKTAPSQNYMKVWDNAYCWSSDKILQGDVITYDSYKDLIYAYGLDGHSVIWAEQHAAGQPIQPGAARAVQLNPKTGGVHIIDSEMIQLLDKNTGIRPGAAGPVDPYVKKPKRVKKPFKLPRMNVERRGFTGQ